MSWLFLDDECSCFSFLNDILLTATKVQRTAVMREVTWRRKKKAEAIYPVQLNSLIAFHTGGDMGAYLHRSNFLKTCLINLGL